MRTYVADTHALYWHLTASPRLGTAAVRVFDEAARGEARILIPAIVLAELFWILAKQDKQSSFAGIIEALAALVPPGDYSGSTMSTRTTTRRNCSMR